MTLQFCNHCGVYASHILRTVQQGDLPPRCDNCDNSIDLQIVGEFNERDYRLLRELNGDPA